MQNNKKHILITNDDGIDAPGIRFLWEAMAPFGDISIVAPSSEKSGAGLSLTLWHPLHIEQVKWPLDTPCWKVSGTPADCVRMAMGTLLKKKPDLIVSGINKGSNAGRNLLYSGTVGGVIEGALRNIPGIAFSCGDFANPDYKTAQKYVAPIVNYLLDHPLPKGSLLNVNFPNKPGEIRGVKLAKQGMSYWIENPDERLHPEGYPYFWLGGKWDIHNEHAESDIELLSQGYAAVVPIHISELTDHREFENRKADFENYFNR